MIEQNLDKMSLFLRDRANSILPDRIELFDIGGRCIFPIYGASGGISASLIFYLLKRGLTAREGVEIPHGHTGVTPEKILEYLDKGTKRFSETLYRLEDRDGLYVNMDGGDLGREQSHCPMCGKQK